MKCSKYFGTKWRGFEVFWRQEALVVLRVKISVMIITYQKNIYLLSLSVNAPPHPTHSLIFAVMGRPILRVMSSGGPPR